MQSKNTVVNCWTIYNVSSLALFLVWKQFSSIMVCVVGSWADWAPLRSFWLLGIIQICIYRLHSSELFIKNSQSTLEIKVKSSMIKHNFNAKSENTATRTHFLFNYRQRMKDGLVLIQFLLYTLKYFLLKCQKFTKII